MFNGKSLRTRSFSAFFNLGPPAPPMRMTTLSASIPRGFKQARVIFIVSTLKMRPHPQVAPKHFQKQVQHIFVSPRLPVQNLTQDSLMLMHALRNVTISTSCFTSEITSTKPRTLRLRDKLPARISVVRLS